jgi:hypothetical protein
MFTSEDCRDYARRCLEMANKFEDEKLQSKLFDMAREWNRVAAGWNGTLPCGAELKDAPSIGNRVPLS